MNNNRDLIEKNQTRKMKNIIKTLLIFALPVIILGCDATGQNKGSSYELLSPGGQNRINFELVNDAPRYAVSHGETEVISLSKMGFVLRDNDSLSKNFEVINVEETSFDETWEQVWGEKQHIRNNYNQLIVELQEKDELKRKLEIHFRAYDDGVAFRYVSPEQGINDSIFIMDELTTFNLKNDGKAWWIPAYHEQRYEQLFEDSPLSALDTVHTPLTIESESGLAISFHEANLTDFASMVLHPTSGPELKAD